MRLATILLLVFATSVMATPDKYAILTIKTTATQHDKDILIAAINGTFDHSYTLDDTVTFKLISDTNVTYQGGCWDIEDGKTSKDKIDKWIKDHGAKLDNKQDLKTGYGKVGKDILGNMGLKE